LTGKEMTVPGRQRERETARRGKRKRICFDRHISKSFLLDLFGRISNKVRFNWMMKWIAVQRGFSRKE
jgi:hypothetical protein